MTTITKVTLHEVSFKGRRYIFKEALSFEVKSQDGEGIVEVFSEKLPIHGYGLTVEEAFSDFCCSLDFQWNSLVEDSDENLTPGAIEKKGKIKEWVRVEESPLDPKSLCQLDLALLGNPWDL